MKVDELTEAGFYWFREEPAEPWELIDTVITKWKDGRRETSIYRFTEAPIGALVIAEQMRRHECLGPIEIQEPASDGDSDGL